MRVPAAARLGESEGRGAAALAEALDRGAIALAAEQVGGAQRCLDLSVAYAKERVQFGRPIGSFQAIKHKCADMMLLVESARSAAYHAALVAAQGGEELAAAASLAKAWCGDAYFRCAGEAIQIHGGVGFTWEYDPHLHFKRARSSQSLLGDAELAPRARGARDRTLTMALAIDLSDRVALVTGGGRGVGRGIARAPARGRRRRGDLRPQRSRSRCPRADGRRAHFVAADVRELEQRRRAGRRRSRGALRPPRRARQQRGRRAAGRRRHRLAALPREDHRAEPDRARCTARSAPTR